MENLQEFYELKKINEIDKVTSYDFSQLKEATIKYIKTLDFEEVFLQILSFNISIIRERNMFLPIYYIDETWMVLKIKEMNIVNPLESEVSIYKTNMSLDDINFNSNLLRIIDFIKNTKKGKLLNFFAKG
jgi:hypothetical protein